MNIAHYKNLTLLSITLLIGIAFAVIAIKGSSHAQTAATITFNNMADGSGTNSQIDPAGQLYGVVTGLPDNGSIQYCFEQMGKTSGENSETSCDFSDNLYWKDAKTDPDWSYQGGEWQATFDPVSDYFSGKSYKYWFRDTSSNSQTAAASFSIQTTDADLGDNVCHSYNKDKPVPDNFGAAYNTLSTSQETLILGICDQYSANVSIGNGDPLMYVYHKAYQWVNNERWEAFDLDCDIEKIDLDWCVGQASGTLQNIIASEKNYLLAYTCQWNGADWQCGCKDEACGEKAWQLQVMQSYAPFIPLPPITPGTP